MTVVSLCDGMSCGQIALNRAGIPYSKYIASEIDKHAIKVTLANYPSTIQIGDIKNVSGTELGMVDLLIAGTPCQGFSKAGGGLGFNDPRSQLFFEAVRIKNECNPKWFLFENVRMKKEDQDVISNLLGCQPVRINSSLVSAQLRDRLYWTNIPYFGPPEDRGIMLKDILESGETDRLKSLCIDANYYKGGSLNNYLKKKRRQLGQADSAIQLNPDKSAGGKQPYMQDRVYSPDGKSVALTQFCNRLNVALTQSERRLQVKEKSNTQRVGGMGSPPESRHCWDNIFDSKIYYRKLTVLECERLQTVPEGYTNSVSKTQAYKMLGNGWTIDVIAHLFQGIKADYIKQIECEAI